MEEKKLRLQPRLQCLADLVPYGAALADVGTDHGYLPVWLLQEGRINRAVASDINRGPLEHAERTARLYGVAERIDFRLCPGLEGFTPEDADTVVIAGMGGETIIAILEAAPCALRERVRFLLQPMTKAELLRRWLTGHGMRIEAERLAQDKGTIYPVLCAAAGEDRALNAAEAWCGRGLERDPLYAAYANDRIARLERAAAGLRKGKILNTKAAEVLEMDAAQLREMVKEWEHAKRE